MNMMTQYGTGHFIFPITAYLSPIYCGCMLLLVAVFFFFSSYLEQEPLDLKLGQEVRNQCTIVAEPQTTSLLLA